MKKSSVPCFILIIAATILGCGGSERKGRKNAPKSPLSLHVGDEKYLQIDTNASVVTWKGSSLNGLNTQSGYVHISKGELMVNNGQPVGGTVEIDMNTIADKKHGRDNKLVNHLKDPDFFEVEKYPFATIVLTEVAQLSDERKNVTGNLTIKGITHQVNFPAKIVSKDSIIEANARLVIDRTKWNVRYKSAKFYKLLANQTMSDSIEFQMKILTVRK
ncbi:YceI family protein [Mucilaginibacter daejeonensis]|uniref:YceI family protein n=1 Tax=Mucilaginibacter daejeonensis TaxID=398049 RepID=UPI001D17BB0A|nr:YceI family protein [Mucilaginibacter daejeonensis]UEG51846.1 YceI family protein [Mucilaginibacter daejeonensis]